MTPKELIRRALAAKPDFVSAQLLHARLLIDGHRIGLNTVYRVLRELVDTGKADVIRDPGGGQLYRLRTGPWHSHYLFCRRCGHSIPVQSEFVEHWARTAGETHGFVDVEHTIELVGVCAECAATAQQPGLRDAT
jgi:Fur family ferric uptake transcriptional regulator